MDNYITQGTITPTERSIAFASKFPDKILDKIELYRFLGSLNYILDFCPNINHLVKILHDRLKKNPVTWSDHLTKIIYTIKKQVLKIPCLHIANPLALKIMETDASELGYGRILK